MRTTLPPRTCVTEMTADRKSILAFDEDRTFSTAFFGQRPVDRNAVVRRPLTHASRSTVNCNSAESGIKWPTSR